MRSGVMHCIQGVLKLLLPPTLIACLGLSFSCQPSNSSKDLAPISPIEAKGETPSEIIWAGLAGTPPRFIDSGDEKGFGYQEIESKLIRKGLEQQGFKIKYEYFSSARIAHEFSKKSPICFYPVEWKDPKKTFSKTPDRIYSVGLDFAGEEARSILIRKKDRAKFEKYLDPKGILRLKALLADPELKTLIPTFEGLGPEFEGVYRAQRDGTIEITERYRKHISTRVIRNNNQLIQMLEGDRFDYLLDSFVTLEDYKAIRGGRTPFVELIYAAHAVKDILEPVVTLTSVACAIHETTLKAMPWINRTIRTLRGTTWSRLASSHRKRYENEALNNDNTNNLASRFGPALVLGSADAWYPLQTRYFPQLKLVPDPSSSESLGLSGARSEESSVAPTAPRPPVPWLLVLSKNAVWILPKADALDLATSKNLGYFRGALSNRQGPCSRSPYQAWSHEQLRLLQDFASGGTLGMSSKEGSFEDVISQLHQLTPKIGEIGSFSFLARGISPSEMKLALSLIHSRKLKTLEITSAGQSALAEVLRVLPEYSALEELSLWGSDLGEQRLSATVAGLPRLRSVNLSCTSGKNRTDIGDSLLALSPETTRIQAAYQGGIWSEEWLRRWSQKSFPHLQILDLEGNDLDDRQCQMLDGLSPALTQLSLNGNFFTSHCLQSILSKPFPNLHTLELAFLRVSTLKNSTLTFPASVTNLDLSYSLNEESFAHLRLPPQLESLRLKDSQLGMHSLAIVAKHLGPHLAHFDLSNSTGVGSKIFDLLKNAGVSQIGDLQLRNTDSNAEAAPLEAFKIERFDFTNTQLSNASLRAIASAWGPSLIEASLGLNRLSSKAIGEFLAKSPKLKSLDLSYLPDLEGASLAEFLPKGLQRLSLLGSGLTDHDLEVLSPKLPLTLQTLDLSESLFGVQGASALSQVLKTRAPHLGRLGLDRMQLSEGGWNQILQSLPANLLDLNFGPAVLGVEGTARFLDLLPRGLKSLTLGAVDLRLARFEAFIQKLPGGLETLRLQKSSRILEAEVKPRSVSTLSEGIHFPESLRVLSLFSGFDLATLEILMRALSSDCEIGIATPSVNGEVLAESLQKHWSPYLVMLQRAKLTPSILRELNQLQPGVLILARVQSAGAQLSSLNPSALKRLKVLDAAGIDAPPSELVALLKKLPPNLFHISLVATRLSYKDVDALLRALPPGLHTLTVTGTDIGPRGIEKINAYVRKNEEETGLKMRVEF